MSFLRKMASVLLGSSEEKLVKAKREVAYSATKAMHPKEAEAVEQMVKSSYENALEKIIYTIGNTARHHAKLSSPDALINSPVMERFVDNYGFQYFINGVSLGYQLQAGTADSKFQEELTLLMESLHNEMMGDAVKTLGSQKQAECFSAAAKVAADLGVEAGAQMYEQGYILVKD